MGKHVNTFMIREYNEALSSQNEMKENIEGLAWSNVPKPHAPTIHNSDTLDDGTDDIGCGIPMIELSSSEKDNLNAPWKYSLIAKVLGREIALQYCQVHLHRLWSLEGTVDIIDLGYGFFLLKFSLPADYNKVFDGVPWLIHGCNITLRPWIPNFKPSEASIAHAKVWIRLPELPIEYYDKEVLFRIGAAIGRTIKIDPITEKQTRGRFARLCVEVDLRRSLLPQIKLGELQQKIIYEGYIDQLQQDHSRCLPNSTHSYSSSHTKFVHQNVASNNRNTSTNATWLQVPSWPRKCPQKPERDSGSQGPRERAVSETGLASSGSRFSVLELENHLDPAAEPKPSHGKFEYTSMSRSSTYNGKNIGSNNGMGKKQCPKAGEGKSLSASEAFSPAKDGKLAATKLPMVEEALTGHVGASAKQPLDSLKQLQKPCTSSLPLPSTLSLTEVIALPAELGPLQHSNSVLKNASCLSLNQPQPLKQSTIPQLSPMPDATIQFHSEVMQRSTKHRNIKRIPALVQLFQELSTESSPTVFSIDSAISDIEIGVSISPLPTGKANHHSITFTPSQTNYNMNPFPKGQAGMYQSISKAIPESLPKKLLCWNCRGAGDLKFMRAMKDLIERHNPSMVVLLEPKISGGEADKVIKEIGFSGRCIIDPEGFAHGIWMLWRKEDVQVEVTSSTPHQIQFSVRVLFEAFNSMLCDIAAETHSLNGMLPFGEDDNLNPFSQAWRKWVPLSKEVEVGHISSWA